MNKSIISYIVAAALIVVPAVMVNAEAPSTGSSVSSASPAPVSTPATGSSVSSAAPASTPAPGTGSSVSGAAPAASPAPSTGSSVSSASPADNSTGGNTSGNTNTNVSSGSTSSSGGVSSGSGSRVSTASITGGQNSCLFTGGMLKRGANNNFLDVVKLQNFLKVNEKMDVDVTGTFDAKTESAVIAFQNKYANAILSPWGANQASGVVYITTMKKINQIVCNIPLTLSASEIATITGYANRTSLAGSNGQTDSDQVGPSINGDATNGGASEGEIGTEGSDSDSTAAAGNTSIFGRFWKFIVNMFK